MIEALHQSRSVQRDSREKIQSSRAGRAVESCDARSGDRSQHSFLGGWLRPDALFWVWCTTRTNASFASVPVARKSLALETSVLHREQAWPDMAPQRGQPWCQGPAPGTRMVERLRLCSAHSTGKWACCQENGHSPSFLRWSHTGREGIGRIYVTYFGANGEQRPGG
jgi:hypothetical protein